MRIVDAGNSRWPRPGLPALAAVLAAISVLCAVASVAVYAYNVSRIGARVQYLYGDDLVVGVAFPLVGAFLVRRRPGNAVGWVLIATSVLGVNALANQYAVAGLVVSPGTLPGAEFAAWVATWGWTPELAVPVLLPLLFPDGSLPSPRWRPFARVAVACLGVLVAAAMLAPMGIDADHSISNPVGAGPLFTAIVLAMVALIGLILIPVAVLALVLRMRRARGAERAQLQWLSLAAVVTLVLGIAESAVGEPGQEVLWALAMSAIPLGIVIAVVRHHLLDIEVVLNRTVVYGLLSAVVLLGYLIAVAGVGPAAQRTGLVAVVVLALLAASARDRVQRAVGPAAVRLPQGSLCGCHPGRPETRRRRRAAGCVAAAHRRAAQCAAPPVGGRHPGRPAAGPGRGGPPRGRHRGLPGNHAGAAGSYVAGRATTPRCALPAR